MTDVKTVQATTPTTVVELAAQAVEGLSLDARGIADQVDVLVVALAFGLRGYEDREIPSEVVDLPDGLRGLAESICESAEDICRAVASLKTVASARIGTPVETSAHDAATVASLALRFGTPVDMIRRALVRNELGKATGPFGVRLDLLAEGEAP